ncbi:type II toxin-antitoxin system VapC family toxin [Acuticoccus sp. I52.16.1]|uniref:type II toxin-antitoxin system VapC family toxin n=1 Tax=Acuticoccus sp. I52.16.1 TaxID=2928472 RepID=UPI001FD5B123|nr:type II toxin-antitoxin system VapC family toxin [Acuticoccus sp. I52.16.1]UOM37094.1 type II toxin-antitoxin system VapC family toxin [Acuticoccus sp. I52.16.1]
MRFLLDTNIISNAVKPQPSEPLLAWLGDQSDQDLFIATLTVAELRRGVLEKSAGKRRRALEAWFDGPDGPRALFAGRILAFDEAAAFVWAELMAEASARGCPRSALDTMIAAIALANDCTVVTDNEKDFDGIPFINPLRPAR